MVQNFAISEKVSTFAPEFDTRIKDCGVEQW